MLDMFPVKWTGKYAALSSFLYVLHYHAILLLLLSQDVNDSVFFQGAFSHTHFQ